MASLMAQLRLSIACQYVSTHISTCMCQFFLQIQVNNETGGENKTMLLWRTFFTNDEYRKKAYEKNAKNSTWKINGRGKSAVLSWLSLSI